MPRFAHIENNLCRDVKDNDSAEEYLKRWHEDVTKGWVVVQVKDDTEEFADGATLENPPPPPPPPPVPITLSKTAFNKFGWSCVGMPRHQKIMEDTKNYQGSDDLAYEVRGAYNQYEAANTFEKSEVKALSDLLVAAKIMTADEQDKYIADWPTG